MTDLERRYRRLVRIFYPAGHHDARGTEIIDTYLALASPDRRWPAAADVTDLAAGGLRQHARAAGATEIGAGVRLAATLALSTATALAGGWAVLEVNPWTVAWFGFAQHGTPVSLGVGVWAAWLLAAVVHLVAPGRWTRPAIGLALVVTVAVVPFAAVVDQARPPLFVLLAQAGLGFVALGSPGRPPVWRRLLPLAGAAAALPVAAAVAYRGGETFGYYGWPAGQVLPGAGLALLLVAALAAGHGRRRVWALSVLLTPIGLLWLHPLAEGLAVSRYGGGPHADTTTLATAAIVVSVAGAVIATSAAVTVRRRITFPARAEHRNGVHR
ncbi:MULTISPECIES: hypothetical protein [Catenuloplanes]|uniref:Uncharacterized protein n=1 Tax=Catenuloplanes niger TaxID=587534 RepID=A0AAE4A2H9_9ACTN|nr:hypothetical protein [Catenuloplanes niger]MDR7328020.1 hypothetical protein [Catenuloplanes niger]